MDPTGSNITLTHRPGFIRAYATTSGQIWLYRSALVKDTDPMYLNLWTTICNHSGKLILADEFNDNSMMFGTAKLEVWQL